MRKSSHVPDRRTPLPDEPYVPEAGSEPFPGYRLLRLRGRGGFATVWEASSPSGERVALKFMSSGNAHPNSNSYSYTDADANRDSYAHRYSYRDPNSYTYGNTDPDCDSHRYANSNGNANAESDCNRNPDIDADLSVHGS